MTPSERDYELASHLDTIHKGANWFYWIVGLSLVNLAMAVAGADTHFIIGLAYSEFATAFITVGESMVIRMIGGVLAIIVLTGFLFIGRKAHQPSKGWFMAGIILYGIDGLLFLYFEDYMSGIFHAYVLYNLIMGYRAITPYNQALAAVVTDEPAEPAVYDLSRNPEADSTVAASDTTGNGQN